MVIYKFVFQTEWIVLEKSAELVSEWSATVNQKADTINSKFIF